MPARYAAPASCSSPAEAPEPLAAAAANMLDEYCNSAWEAKTAGSSIVIQGRALTSDELESIGRKLDYPAHSQRCMVELKAQLER